MSSSSLSKLLLFSILSLCSEAAMANECSEVIDSSSTRTCPAQQSSKRHFQEKSRAPIVTHSINVNASPENVWAAIKHQRTSDMSRKLISYEGNSATLRETFGSLPIVGEASCIYVENESSLFKRIDYNMLKSDQFMVFQGSWIISETKDGKTRVELSNEIDPGIRVPFWQDITRIAANRFVKKRLADVNSYAEQLQKMVSIRIP